MPQGYHNPIAVKLGFMRWQGQCRCRWQGPIRLTKGKAGLDCLRHDL